MRAEDVVAGIVGAAELADKAGGVVVAAAKNPLRVTFQATFALMREAIEHERARRFDGYLNGIAGAQDFGDADTAREALEQALGDERFRRDVLGGVRAALEAVDEAAVMPLAALMARHLSSPLAPRVFRTWCLLLEGLDEELLQAGCCLADMLRGRGFDGPCTVRATRAPSGLTSLRAWASASPSPQEAAPAPAVLVEFVLVEFIELLKIRQIGGRPAASSGFLNSPGDEGMIVLSPEVQSVVMDVFVRRTAL